jgi:hypothetical protein
MSKFWIMFILLVAFFLCLIIAEVYSEPIQITYNGIDGYFLTKQDFTDVLLVLSDLKYYRELSAAYKREIVRLKQTNIITGGVGLLLLGVNIWQGMNQ